MSVNIKHYIPLALLAIIAVLSFFILKPFFGSLFLGALLAYVFTPIYRFFNKKLAKSLSALFVCVLILILILVPGVFLVKSLVQESYVLFILAKQKLATGIFTDCGNQICQAIAEFTTDPNISIQVQEFVKVITDWVIQKGSALIFSLPLIFLNLFVVFFTMFYFLRDGKRFEKYIRHLFFTQKKKYEFVITRLKEVIRGVVFGYLVLAVIQGAFGALGFFLFGVPSPLFWGGMMSLFALIPFLGTGVIWVPAGVLLLLDGIFTNSTPGILKGIGLLVYCIIFVASSDNLLRPKIVGDRAKIHPAIIMLGTLGGILFFGALGIIIGPIILSLLMIFSKVYFVKEYKES